MRSTLSHPHLLLAVVCLPVLALACIEPPVPPSLDTDGSSSLAIVDVRVTAQNGMPARLDAAPEWPIIEIDLSAPLDEPGSCVFLVAADPADVADNLASAPIRAATRDATVRVALAVEGPTVRLTPLARLARGTSYALGVASWARAGGGPPLGEPHVVALRVRDDGTAGARVAGAWPADGTSGVPTNIAMAAVRFDGDVDPVGLRIDLLGSHGAAVEGDRSLRACSDIGWSDGTCAVFVPREALAPAATYRLFVPGDVLDATGAPLGPWSAEITTANDITPRIALDELPCALDETTVDGACVLADDDRITIRAHATGPARFFASAEGSVASAVAPRGDATLTLRGLGPSREVAVDLRTIDLAGRETVTLVPASTTEPLARVFITEVRADPRGPEPAQELVEVLNSAAVPIDLQGFALSDRADREGDVVIGSVLVAAGARALFVADSFDPRQPDDPAVPDGVVLVHIGASLGSGGLSNAGEPLFLRDAAGRRISAAPAMRAPGPGICLVRVSTDGRTGEADAFAPDPAGGCSPGR